MNQHSHLMICFRADGEAEFFPEGDSATIVTRFRELLQFFRKHPEAVEHVGHNGEQNVSKAGRQSEHGDSFVH